MYTYACPGTGAPSDFENNWVWGNLSINPRGFTLLKFFSVGHGGKTLIRVAINCGFYASVQIS